MTAERTLPSWAAPAGVAVALALLVVWSFFQRWGVLTSTPFPVGVDGYFYPVQLRSILETGGLQYPASPLAFYLLAPFAAATDPITGAKLGAAVLGALIALPAYAVGAELGRHGDDRGRDDAELGRDGDDRGRGPGLVAAALATSSAGSLYLTVEFVKNGIGLTVAMTALWLVLRALRMPSRRTAGIAIAGIVAAMLTHKMAAGLVLGIAIPAAIVEAHRRGKLKWRRALPLAIAGGVLGVIVLIGILMPQRFLSPTDLDLIDGLFTTDADWSLPLRRGKSHLGYEPVIALVLAAGAAIVLVLERPTARARLLLIAVVVQVAGELIGVGTLIAGSGVILWVVAGAGIALAVGGMFLRHRVMRWPGATPAAREGAGRNVVAWSAIALAMLIALPWLDTSSSQGLAMRLRVIAFVPMALCGAIIVRALPRLVRLERFRAPIGAGIAVVIVMIHAGSRKPDGLIPTHPALVASAAAVSIPDDGVAIVPERHIAYMVAWYARAKISLRPELVEPERRYRVMPLHFIGARSQLDRALIGAREDPSLSITGVHPLHPNGMVVVPEASWRAVLEHIEGIERMRLDVWPTL